jgi:hypothetical protein
MYVNNRPDVDDPVLIVAVLAVMVMTFSVAWIAFRRRTDAEFGAPLLAGA